MTREEEYRMTIEEAIKVLDDMKIKIYIPKSAITQRKRNEALNMAIKALETQGLKNGIPYRRMDEIATKAIDKLIENDPYDAEEFLREEIYLDLEEAQYFCIDETLDMVKRYEEEDEEWL